MMAVKTSFFWHMMPQLVDGFLAYTSTLKIVAICFSEMSFHVYRITLRFIPKDITLQYWACFRWQIKVNNGWMEPIHGSNQLFNCRIHFDSFVYELYTSHEGASCLLHDGLLLGWLVLSEDGGDIFLRNVAWLSVDRTLRNHRCGGCYNLKLNVTPLIRRIIIVSSIVFVFKRKLRLWCWRQWICDFPSIYVKKDCKEVCLNVVWKSIARVCVDPWICINPWLT
jgi:hypothetical protein